jgi:hypothetical protein
LSSRANKTIAEKISFHFLGFLKAFKERINKALDLRSSARATNYGFHRWDHVIEGDCTIHLPWYDKRQWSRLYVRVQPGNRKYRIRINGEPCKHKPSEQGSLIVDVPPLKGPYRKISIECLDKKKWRLLEFSCELT